MDAARPRIVPRLPWPPFSPNFGEKWKQQTSKSFKSWEGFFFDVEISVGMLSKNIQIHGVIDQNKNKHMKQTNEQTTPVDLI